MHTTLTALEHQQIHQRLHKELEQLVADFITHNPYVHIGTVSVLQLMQWSSTQIHNALAGEVNDG